MLQTLVDALADLPEIALSFFCFSSYYKVDVGWLLRGNSTLLVFIRYHFLSRLQLAGLMHWECSVLNAVYKKSYKVLKSYENT